MIARRPLAASTLVLLASLASCIGANLPEYRPAYVRDVDTQSDKVVQVVSNARQLEDHEARTVAPAAVGSAMLASGFFHEEDARDLREPIAAELAAMGPREQLRIVAWDDDAARIYYMFINRGKLRIALYKRGQELERHDSIVPTEAVALAAPPAPVDPAAPADPGVAVPPAGTPPAAAPPPPATSAPPAHDAATAVASAPPRPRRRSPAPQPPPISEDEARKKLRELDAALDQGLVTPGEHKSNRKAILARL